MILTCGNCAKRYLVSDTDINPEGRYVRCIACNHRWLQKTEDLEQTSNPASLGVKPMSTERPSTQPPAVHKPSEAVIEEPCKDKECPTEATSDTTRAESNNSSDTSSTNPSKSTHGISPDSSTNESTSTDQVPVWPRPPVEPSPPLTSSVSPPAETARHDRLFVREDMAGNDQHKHHESQQHFSQKAAAQPSGQTPESSSTGLVISVLVLGLLSFLGYFCYIDRTEVVAKFPGTQAIYDAVGIAVPPPKKAVPAGVNVTNIKPEYIQEDGVKLILVQGVVQNTSKAPFELRDLTVDMMGSCENAPLMTRLSKMVSSKSSKKCIVSAWAHTMPKRILAPGETLTFKTGSHPIPKGAQTIRVHF